MLEKKIDYGRVLTFLEYHNTEIPEDLEILIREMIFEVAELSKVKFCHTQTHDLTETNAVSILFALTLGAEVDNRIRFYEKVDVTRAIIADAAANVLIECLIEQLEAKFLNIAPELSAIQYPGNQNIPLEWNQKIANFLDTPKRIGLYVTEHYGLIPQKSVLGLISPTTQAICSKNKCDNCTIRCKYRKKRVSGER